ncbi:hypothetical protein EV359DRAFT_88263 [Lentinula novae-zelandiae]|nr:hypothetical protein EV359DRAFT_88263 [Lentinula novae-zelandiae]
MSADAFGSAHQVLIVKMHCEALVSCYSNLEKHQSLIDDFQKLSEANPYPQANSSSWTTYKQFSLWLSKGKLWNPMTANVEKSQDVFWYPAMKTPPPKFIPPAPLPMENGMQEE